jgi:hypothetical protein
MMFMFPGIDESDWEPNAEAVAAMSRYNEELTKAGALLALDGLQPASKGARVTFSGGSHTVTDGPFTETKEVIGGYWIIQARSKEEAVEWASRFIKLHRDHWAGWTGSTDVLQVMGPEGPAGP